MAGPRDGHGHCKVRGTLQKRCTEIDFGRTALTFTAPTVCIRRVEKGDTKIERRVNDGTRPIRVERTAEIISREANHRNLEA